MDNYVLYVNEAYVDNVIIHWVLHSRGAGKGRFNVATPTNATVTCTAYVLPYNLQTKSI